VLLGGKSAISASTDEAALLLPQGTGMLDPTTLGVSLRPSLLQLSGEIPKPAQTLSRNSGCKSSIVVRPPRPR